MTKSNFDISNRRFAITQSANKPMGGVAEAEGVPSSDRRLIRGRRTGRASDRTHLMGGQALVMLLFFIMIGITITTTAIFIIAGNSLAAGNTEMGEVTREMADTGIERALLMILRNGGGYTGETLTSTDVPEWSNDWSTIISVNGSSNLTIDSVAKAGNYIKKVEVTGSYVDNELIIGSWKEK